MKITKEELMQELIIMMSDEFIADVKQNDGKITLKFLDGQKFDVEIREAQ